MNFYLAHSVRRMIKPSDIIDRFTCDSYEKAYENLSNIFEVDDDQGILVKLNEKWYRVWGKTKDGFFLSAFPNAFYSDRTFVPNDLFL